VIDGEPGDPIGGGLSVVSIGSGGAENQTSQDVIEPLSGAAIVFKYSADSVAAIRYFSGTYRVVYYSFGLEGVDKIPGYSGRDTLLTRSLEWAGCPVPIELEEETPGLLSSTEPMLLQCYPSPFRGSLAIDASASAASTEVSISVYDLAGRLVRTLAEDVRGFPISLSWDGRDKTGKGVVCGVYFVKLTSGPTSIAQKIVLMR